MRFTLHGARLIDSAMNLAEGAITVNAGRIQTISTDPETTENAIDITGAIVMPGFIDVHTHGGGGCNLQTVLVEEVLDYGHWVASTGVTSFLIAVVGTPNALPEEQIRTAARAVSLDNRGAAEPLGIHLEGPFISERRRGAHLPSWLRLPNTEETERVLDLAQGHLKLITIAPELPGAPEMIQRMIAAGVTVSIGHSDATYEQAIDAIALGVTHMTHCCNAMRPLHHRDSGPLGALAQSPQVFGELIADGVHVHPAMMQILIRALGPARTVVVTDALAGAGIHDMAFDFAGQEARVEEGAARLADGTITGSILTMDAALRNMLSMTDATLSEAVGMVTANPARTIHVDDHKGRLIPGFDADLVILDESLHVGATFCRGTLAYVAEEWRDRLATLGGV